MPMLTDIYGEQQKQDTYANPGARSLAGGMQEWIDEIKQKRQKKAFKAIAELFNKDKISINEVYQHALDADIDPASMMQGLGPMIKEKKRQQFGRVLPIVAGILQEAETSGEPVQMSKIFEACTSVGLSGADAPIAIKMVMDSDVMATIGQQIQKKGQRLEAYEHGAKYGLSLEPGGKVQFKKDTGLKPYETPGFPQQTAPPARAQPPQQQGLMGSIGSQPPSQGQRPIMGGAPQQASQYFPRAPAQLKPPSSPTALFAQDPTRFRQMKQIEQDVKPPGILGPKSHTEQRMEGKDELELLDVILGKNEDGIPNVELNPQSVQSYIDRFNAITKQPYRYIITAGKKGSGVGPDFMYSDTPAKVEKVSAEEFEKRNRSKTSTEGSWRDYLK